MKRGSARGRFCVYPVTETTVTTLMQRRKLVIGLGSIIAGGAAAIGIGAFTNTTADHNIEIAVADDADTFLQLEAMENSPNADAFVEEKNNTITIDITDSGGGDGLSPNVVTEIKDLFQIQNQGKQEVEVYIDEKFEPVRLKVSDTSKGSDQSDDLIIGNSNGEKQELEVDESADVSLVVDTGDYGSENALGDEFAIVAEATGS